MINNPSFKLKKQLKQTTYITFNKTYVRIVAKKNILFQSVNLRKNSMLYQAEIKRNLTYSESLSLYGKENTGYPRGNHANNSTVRS